MYRIAQKAHGRMRYGITTLVLAAALLSGCGNAEPSTSPPTAEPTLATPTAAPSTPTPSASPSEPEETATAAPSAFPQPTAGQAVYDVADVLDEATEAQLEAQVDAIETDTGMSVVLYLDLNPDATLDNSLAAARALMNAWQVGGTTGDGLVILVSFDESRQHGIISTYAGAGMLEVFPEDMQTALREEVMIPTFRSDSIQAGIVAGIQYVDDALR